MMKGLHHGTLKLNLGCGLKPLPGYVNVDKAKGRGVDLVHDLELPLPFPSSSVHEIFSEHCFEHINNFEGLVKECWRTLKPSGLLHVKVPFFSNPITQIPFHRHLFGVFSFDCMLDKPAFPKASLNGRERFYLKDCMLYFSAPFPLNAVAWLFQCLFNLSRGTQLFYQKFFSYLVPAVEVEFKLGALK